MPPALFLQRFNFCCTVDESPSEMRIVMPPESRLDDLEKERLLAGSEGYTKMASLRSSRPPTSAERCCECLKCTTCVVCTPLLMLVIFVLIETLIYLSASHTFQKWALLHPSSVISSVFLPPVAVVESNNIGQTMNLVTLQQGIGNNFCAAGMVWLCSYEDVSTALTSPQARTDYLGEHPLLYESLPDTQRSRSVFLLSLSDKEAGGSGEHEAFRHCFERHLLTSPRVEERRQGKTAERLLDALAKDYDELPHDWWGQAFYNDTERGLTPFVTKYLHYVMFGIDPDDHELFKTLEKFYLGQVPIAHYFWPHGYSVDYNDIIDQVIEIYEDSPSLKDFKAKSDEFDMTKRELGALSVAIMRIAGIQGFSQLAKIVTGAWTMPQYPGLESSLDQKNVWDQLDLNKTEEVEQYILECARLDAPVSVTHRVATEPFSTVMDGANYTFPEGTKIAIPIALANVDKDFWGPDAYEFDINRAGLRSNVLSFNSVGDHSAGRECPGKALVMRTLTEVVIRLGRIRQSAAARHGKGSEEDGEASDDKQQEEEDELEETLDRLEKDSGEKADEAATKKRVP